MRKIIAILLLFSIAFPVIMIDTSNIEGQKIKEPTRYTYLQAPIRVDDDIMMYDLALIMGLPGDGTTINPYIISGYAVNSSGFGAGIYLGNISYSVIIRDCWIHNTTLTLSTYFWGAGIALYNVSDVKVQGCRILDTRVGVLMVESRGVVVNHTTVKRTQFEGMGGFQVENVVVRDNKISGVMNGISFGNNVNILRVSSNVLDTGTGRGIFVSSGVTNCSLTGNEIRGFANDGIYISNSGDISVNGNFIRGSTRGIYIDGYIIGRSTNSNMLINNEITQCMTGIYTTTTGYNTIEGNNVSYSEEIGMEIGVLSDNCTIRENILWMNTRYAISLSGSGHLVHNNTFHFNNGSNDVHDPRYVQAYDGSLNSMWYLEGRGNIWTDWRSPDMNGDGIVDEPYQIHSPPTYAVYDPYPVSDYSPPDIYPPSSPSILENETGRFYVNISWHPPVDDGGSSIIHYTVYRSQGGSNPIIIAEPSADTPFYNDTNVMEDTIYNYRVSASNEAGEGEWSQQVTTRTPVPLGTPSVEILQPLDGDVFHADGLMVEWEYQVANTTFHHFDIDTGEGWIDIGNSTEYLLSDLSSGEHVVKVRLNTLEMLTAVDEVKFNVSITPPFINITAPLAPLNDDPVQFTWQLLSSGSNITRVEYRINDGNWTSAGISNSISIPGLPEGQHTFHLRAMDTSGGTSTDTLVFTIDRTPPIVVDYGPVGLDEAPGVVIYASLDEIVESAEIYLEPEVNGTLNINDLSFVTFIPEEPLVPGVEYIVHLRALDPVGNLLFPFSWSFRVESKIVLTMVYGYVTDEEGRQLQDAVVTLGNLSLKTNAFGEFQFEVRPGVYHFSIYKSGFVEYKMDITVVSTGEYEIGLVSLEREAEADGGEEDTEIPWIPIIIIVIGGGALVIGYLTLKQRSSQGEFDIEE